MKKPSGQHVDLPPSSLEVSPPSSGMRWGFGSFLLWENQRRLESFGQAVKLGSRSFDMLLQLLRRAGEVVSKDDLLSAVWADVVVEEASVRVHMSQLRKALGAPGASDECKEWISNIPLRGYRFNGRVLREVIKPEAAIRTRPAVPLAKLPLRLTELIGRENDVANILQSLDSHRLVTVVGTGGIGKTSVAIRVAQHRQQTCATEVAFIDLAPLVSPKHVLGAMARALGSTSDLPDPVQAMTQCLAGRNVVMLIDNCEQVMDALALPISRLLSGLPGLRILATSRETLGIFGEYVYRLPPLEIPEAEHFLLAQAVQWPAVALLVELARAAGAGVFTESDGPLLARIARQLDGIPLAIELVAARLGVQSISDLALRLDDHLRLLSIGNRAAAARHQSLAAALDWSVALLNGDELRVFRCLSVFRGRFDMNSALGVIATDMDSELAFDALISLANKSLVLFDNNDPAGPYRLLDTTRSYASTLLAQNDERSACLRRHAQVMINLMNQAAEWPDLTEQAWRERYSHYLEDVRFALEVCLTEQADANTAASLLRASAPLWLKLSQVTEYRDRVAATLKQVDLQPVLDVEMAAWLATALMIALMHTDGTDDEINGVCDRALAGALASGVRLLELQARHGRCTHDMFRGEYTAALRQSEKLLAVAQSWGDPAALNLAHRASAMANHFCGRFDAFAQHCEASLQLIGDAGRTGANAVGLDPVVAAKTMQARTLWVQGDTVRALGAARAAVGRAESIGQSASLCAALYGACPVALWSGDFVLADTWIHRMMDEAQRKGFARWFRWAESFFQCLKLGRASNPDAQIRQVVDRFATYDVQSKEMLLTFCPDWIDDEMIARQEQGEGIWCAAEIWRALGVRNERRGDAREAERFYLRALETSRQQGAGGWELRAASSLATLWSNMQRLADAVNLLDETCSRSPVEQGGQAAASVWKLRDEMTRELKLATRGRRNPQGPPA